MKIIIYLFFIIKSVGKKKFLSSKYLKVSFSLITISLILENSIYLNIY